MFRPLVTDSADFAYLRTRSAFYVDKTGFIRDWWRRLNRVTLLLRPHGFGKSLTASTLERFFSLRYSDQENLFSGLSVWQDDKTRAAAGRYPVLALSFADWTGASFKEQLTIIRRYFLRLLEQHPCLTESSLISDTLRRFFSDFGEQSSVADIQYFLQWLCRALEQYFGVKPIIVLDDYDTPFLHAWRHRYVKDMALFMDPLMGLTFKSTQSLSRAVIFSTTYGCRGLDGFNHPDVITATGSKYASDFGFTREEVSEALRLYGLTDTSSVESRYGGFVFGESSPLVKPQSFIQFLSQRTFTDNTVPDKLTTDLFLTACRRSDGSLYPVLQSLLAQNSLTTAVTDIVTYPDFDTNPAELLSLLLTFGLITLTDSDAVDISRRLYRIALPNEETRRIFRELLNTAASSPDVKTAPEFCHFKRRSF